MAISKIPENPETTLDGTVGGTEAALLTRSVITGSTGNNAAVTDHLALQVTPPPEGRSGFGEAAVTEPHPKIQVRFPYDNIDPMMLHARPNQSGTASIANSLLTVTSGAAANSGAEVLTRDRVPYRPGQGTICRFTALFTTGVANSEQWVGIGDDGEGYFVGYQGADFGFARRKGGRFEVRTLTVTTASTTAENITITLDGNADATVAVTNTGDVTLTANEIAAHDYSDVGPGWSASAVGDTVVFCSWSASVQTGTYSLSGATTAVGTFAQTLAGVAPTVSFVAQASWNGSDIFDGTGLSGVTLDPTKGNVYQIRFQYLGFGAIQFFIEDPDDGELHLVHTIEYSNANTTPSLEDPTYPMYIEAKNAANTSDLTVSTASFAAFNEGQFVPYGARQGVEADATLASAVETPIITIRAKEVLGGKINRTPLKLLYVSASAEHTKPVSLKFYFNATLTGASFTDVRSPYSGVQEDISATAFSGGTFFFRINLGKTGNELIDLTGTELDGLLQPGESMTVTVAPKSGSNAEASISLYYVELF